MMDPGWDSKRWHKMVLTVDSPANKSEEINHRGLKSKILKHFLYISFIWKLASSKGLMVGTEHQSVSMSMSILVMVKLYTMLLMINA